MIFAADLFCGAGGTSTGLAQACAAAGIALRLTAINHWQIAVSTHTSNHPDARHLCASLDALNPRELFEEDELDLLLASPECTHHSNARGGRPTNDQSRATAWCVVRWAEALRPKMIIVENVPEFVSWGAIDSKGKPMRSKKGATFLAWVAALESLGYRVSWKILCAADYGDPTTRKRLFVQAVRGNRKIDWPEPSHSPAGDRDLLGQKQQWRSAKEIIDFSLPSTSIFKRKKPLSKNTLSRIYKGLEKFGVTPYIVALDHTGGNGNCIWDRDQPLSTVTTKARHGVVEPYLIELRGTSESQINSTARDIKEPLNALTTSGHHALVEPYLINYYGNGQALSLSEPLDTVTCKDRFALAEPVVVVLEGKRYLLDINFRMLQPHELAGAQGFPVDYAFAGTKTDAVKQIGNAVPVGIARALCSNAIPKLTKLSLLERKVV